MKDINSALLQVYYEAINSLNIPVYEGMEPDDVAYKLYAVISDVISNETSTKNSSDLQATIQISFHSLEYKYNNSKALNLAVGNFLELIKATPNQSFDMSSFGMQMLNLSIQTDRTERFGNLDGRVYISRILIFKQDIFIL
jgi:hypothetical protein